MRRKQQHARLRSFAPRWPSKDHRDFQAEGHLSAWWARRAPAPAAAAQPERIQASAEAPTLTRIVRVSREDALLHVQLLAARPRALAPDLAMALPAGVALDAVTAPDDDERTWTVTLQLN